MSRKTFAVVGVVALLVVASVGVIGLGGAQSPRTTESAADRTITVSATGSAEAAPDQALVDVAVTAAGNDSASVRSALASQATDLRSALDELGVEYETVGYAIREVDERRAEGADAPAYRGVHAFQVTVDDPDAVGSVIDAAADVGATVDGVRLTLSETRRNELREDAIDRAMADARVQAETIANAANLTVTTALTVDASESQYRPVAYETAAAGGADGGATDIDAGDVSVTYTVRVTYNATA